MGLVPGGHDEVRGYLDSAVAEAAERWVGRAADATAYADLVAAVLARRAALSPLQHLPEQYDAEPLPVRPGAARHHERRARPRWPLGGGGPMPSTAAGGQAFSRASPVAAHGAESVGSLDVRAGSSLPTRPPGRHRTPAPSAEAPQAIDLSDNLTTVLDWLGRPDA